MKAPRADELRIAEEAARWQRELERNDPKTQAEFADWIKASPRHVREFMFMEALDAAAKNLDPNLPVERELNLTDDATNVISLRHEATDDYRSTPKKRTHRSWLATAASIAVAAGVAWLAPRYLTDSHLYVTSIGEQRTLELEDGSVLQLNTQSRVQVRYSAESRDVHLLDGEALFKVAHEPSRPFRVRTDDAVIRAVGTQFNVNRRTQGTIVAVIEGKVEVTPKVELTPTAGSPNPLPAAELDAHHLLTAGESARVEDKAVIRTAALNVDEATAWRQRRLVFNEETLAAIADEFNRFNRAPQLVVEGEAARTRRYGGTFDADDPDALVTFISRSGDLEVLRSGRQIVIRERIEAEGRE